MKIENIEQLSFFELSSIESALAEDAPDLLHHIQYVRVKKREHSGVGMYVYLSYAKIMGEVPGDDRSLGMRLYAVVNGLKHGAGIILYVDNGLLTMLEIFSHGGEQMPVNIEGEIIKNKNKRP